MSQHIMVTAAIRQAFLQPEADAARQINATDQRRPRWPELAALIDDGEHDLLAHVTFPTRHRIKPHSTNSLERLNEQVKRRANVLGIFRTRPASPG